MNHDIINPLLVSILRADNLSSPAILVKSLRLLKHNPGGGGRGTQVQGGGGGCTRVTYLEGGFFKTSACPRFCKRRVLFCTQVRRSMGVKIPLQSTKHTRL